MFGGRGERQGSWKYDEYPPKTGPGSLTGSENSTQMRIVLHFARVIDQLNQYNGMSPAQCTNQRAVWDVLQSRHAVVDGVPPTSLVDDTRGGVDDPEATESEDDTEQNRLLKALHSPIQRRKKRGQMNAEALATDVPESACGFPNAMADVRVIGDRVCLDERRVLRAVPVQRMMDVDSVASVRDSSDKVARRRRRRRAKRRDKKRDKKRARENAICDRAIARLAEHDAKHNIVNTASEAVVVDGDGSDDGSLMDIDDGMGGDEALEPVMGSDEAWDPGLADTIICVDSAASAVHPVQVEPLLYMTVSQMMQLTLSDVIDHRDVSGRFQAAQIIAKRCHRLKVHYVESGVEKWTNYQDDSLGLENFATHRSISDREQSTFLRVVVGDMMEVRLMGNQDWIPINVSRVVKGQFEFACTAVAPRFGRTSWWVHGDNTSELRRMRAPSPDHYQATDDLPPPMFDLNFSGSGGVERAQLHTVCYCHDLFV